MNKLNTTRYRPTGNRILVSVYPEPTHSPSGLLHLPEDTFTTQPLRGKVLAKGGRCKLDEIHPGDDVWLHRFASDSVKEIEKGIHLMPETALIAKSL